MEASEGSIQAGSLLLLLPLLLVASLPLPAPARAVALEWVAVGEPGNPCDSETDGCYGSVAYPYEIGRFEVTNAQYAEFLDAVAADDPGALYDARMGSDADFGGITRTGAEGSYDYAAKPGFAAKPVVFVTFWDALRFANWLHNGRPTGAQGPATTEDGAYTLSAPAIAENTVVANPGATHFLPSEDEWHKAAYYAPGLGLFWEYPTQTSVPTACVLPALDDGNAANCWPATSPDGALTDAGAYAASASATGTYDQGGNVREWNETISFTLSRVVRGGSWFTSAGAFAATNRESRDPASSDDDLGFRVARVPEPAAGLAGLAVAGALAVLRRRAREGRDRG
jgi:formylglycine-generating enzyme required for sulfatase activity